MTRPTPLLALQSAGTTTRSICSRTMSSQRTRRTIRRNTDSRSAPGKTAGLSSPPRLSALGEGRSIPIIDRPLLTYLARSVASKPKQGVEAMMSNVYAALFHVAARKHFEDELPDAVAPPLSDSGPQPAARTRDRSDCIGVQICRHFPSRRHERTPAIRTVLLRALHAHAGRPQQQDRRDHRGGLTRTGITAGGDDIK